MSLKQREVGCRLHKGQRCPLCHHPLSRFAETLDEKVYWHCQVCYLRSLDPRFYLSRHQEKLRYLSHRNCIHDPRYQNFVWPLVSGVLANTKPYSVGLDFGCGPGPVATHLLHKHQRMLTLYDPFFFPNQIDHKPFDFIIACEVFEHLAAPGNEFLRLWQILKPGGVFLIRTQMWDHKDFSTWYYRRDPTHIVFFHSRSFFWLAYRYGAKIHFDRFHHCAYLIKTNS